MASGGTRNSFGSGGDLEGLGFSVSVEAEEVGWEELQSAKLDSISENADAGGGHSSGRGVNEAEVLTNFKTSTEVVLDEVSEVTAEGFPSDITGEEDVAAQHLPVVVDMNMPYGDEHKTRGEESSDLSEVVSEHGDLDFHQIHDIDARVDSGGEVLEYSLDGSYSQVEDKEKYKAKWKVSRPRTSHMRKLFTIFIKEIVEGMIGYVKLPRITLKLLSDNGNQEFGDFKLIILGMLGTYDFEKRILDIANDLIQDDTYYTMSLLRKGASHGYAPRNFVCCICNSLLAKNSVSKVQVFSCGHAMHVHCEPEENEDSFKGTSAGCPICNSRKKTIQGQRKILCLAIMD
ncbi:uncharacterized protein LOC142532445 [Primulina tabacum]|uniref:uncharacterized protein LOC142532445 n=1 Tax=Primulina tabacum TaxID=48773 RepID=UPI003F598EF7